MKRNKVKRKNKTKSPRRKGAVKPSFETHERGASARKLGPKFEQVSGRTAIGIELVKTRAVGAIPALVRPGMATYEHSTGNSEQAIVTEVHPDHAIVRTDEGKELTMKYHEMDITFCAPDPAYLPGGSQPTPQPIGFVGRWPDGDLVTANYCLAGNEDIDIPILGRTESEIHACAFACNIKNMQIKAVPVFAVPQEAGMQIAGYAIRKRDGKLLYVECNDQMILEVAATENGAHKTAIDDEVKGDYTIVPVFVGDKAVQS